MGQTKEQLMLKQLSGDFNNSVVPSVTPIGSEIVLPNYSVANNNQFVKKTINDFLPIGSIIMWATNTPPTNYLMCDGSSVLKSQYAALYAVIGGTWGDGGSYFTLPTFKARFPIGVDSEFNPPFNLGQLSGGFSTDNGFANVSDAGHYHGVQSGGDSIASGSGWWSGTDNSYASVTDSGHSHTFIPYYSAINFIIKYQ